MRKCLRCETEMIENKGLMISNIMAGVGDLKLTNRSGLKGVPYGNLKAAVCPSCGYVESYIEGKTLEEFKSENNK